MELLMLQLQVMKVHMALRILFLLVVLCPKGALIAACSGSDELLLCRSCGHEVASGKHVHFIPSPFALSHRNNTIIGDRRVAVQLLENPQGFRFEVLAFKRADVLKHWPADDHVTWFPGFSWTVATCPRCKAHLGWAFQPSEWPKTVTREEFDASDQTFLTLIADRLLQEHFASTLLMTPKSFKS